MNLLIKYYDKDSNGGGIPDEVRKKIDEMFPLEASPDYKAETKENHAARWGYSLASEEISRLKAENERLRKAMNDLMIQYKIEVENDLKLGENIDEWVSDLPSYQKCLELLTPSPTTKK